MEIKNYFNLRTGNDYKIEITDNTNKKCGTVIKAKFTGLKFVDEDGNIYFLGQAEPIFNITKNEAMRYETEKLDLSPSELF